MRHSASKIREILICNDDDLHSYPLMYLRSMLDDRATPV